MPRSAAARPTSRDLRRTYAPRTAPSTITTPRSIGPSGAPIAIRSATYAGNAAVRTVGRTTRADHSADGLKRGRSAEAGAATTRSRGSGPAITPAGAGEVPRAT